MKKDELTALPLSEFFPIEWVAEKFGRRMNDLLIVGAQGKLHFCISESYITNPISQQLEPFEEASGITTEKFLKVPPEWLRYCHAKINSDPDARPLYLIVGPSSGESLDMPLVHLTADHLFIHRNEVRRFFEVDEKKLDGRAKAKDRVTAEVFLAAFEYLLESNPALKLKLQKDKKKGPYNFALLGREIHDFAPRCERDLSFVRNDLEPEAIAAHLTKIFDLLEPDSK